MSELKGYLSSYTHTKEGVCKRREPLVCDSRVCYKDALGGYDSSAWVQLARRQHVLLGALLGDALGVTSEGLHYTKAALLCDELVPWPFVSQGGGVLGIPAKGVNHNGMQALALLRAFETAHEEQASLTDCIIKDLCVWYPSVHSSNLDPGTMVSLHQLTTASTPAEEHMHVGTNEYLVRPNSTATGALSRNCIIPIVIDNKLSAITATVAHSIVTHANPTEVLCCVVHTLIIYDALHLKPSGAPAAYIRSLLCSTDVNQSPWQQWKAEVSDDKCRKWLETCINLRGHEEHVCNALSDAPDFNPFKDTSKVPQYDVVRCLKVALWALHWSAQGTFPPALRSWVRHADYDVPIKYKTRIEKERKMVAAGLLGCVKKDHPGGDLWNPLDAKGSFHALMWVVLLGGNSCAAGMVTGSLLAAYHPIPPTMLNEVHVSQAAFELLRRTVGDDAAPQVNTPTWLTEVKVEEDPYKRIENIMPHYFPERNDLLENTDTAATCALTMLGLSMQLPQHLCDTLGVACLCTGKMDRIRSALPDERLENVRVQQGDDPLDLARDLSRQGMNPCVVYLADPAQLMGQFTEDTPVNEESQLLKRSTAGLALLRRRSRQDDRWGEAVRHRFPVMDPYWPLGTCATVYMPFCYVTRKADFSLLPITERFCTAAILMSHHNREEWEISEIGIIRQRMRNVLRTATSNGHKAIIIPTFGYDCLEQLSVSGIRNLWCAEATNYEGLVSITFT
eukprot:TRINITY_DN2854_c0_g2_i1.p1 TRINITY_DN2854_c0_g2~~TRINITY_DN2854_c0_g2_i1.p1  ORF type:complete len:734 (+),score=143.97 TRINITY_DN2854_c0_g2_i1:1326-3527(+)